MQGETFTLTPVNRPMSPWKTGWHLSAVPVAVLIVGSCTPIEEMIAPDAAANAVDAPPRIIRASASRPSTAATEPPNIREALKKARENLALFNQRHAVTRGIYVPLCDRVDVGEKKRG